MQKDPNMPVTNVDVKDNKVDNQISESDKIEEEEKEEESTRDKIVKKFSSDIADLVKNIIKGKGPSGSVSETTTKIKKPFSLINIVKIIFLGVLVLIIFFGLYIRFFWKKPGQSSGANIPTPTYSSFEKFKPSVYAQDPIVLKLEETVNVLDQEMSTTPLTESTLMPPLLDFNISFK